MNGEIQNAESMNQKNSGRIITDRIDTGPWLPACLNEKIFLLSLIFLAWFSCFFLISLSEGFFSTGRAGLDYFLTSTILSLTGLSFSCAPIILRPSLRTSILTVLIIASLLLVSPHFIYPYPFLSSLLMLTLAGFLGWLIALRIDEKRYLLPLSLAAGLIDIWSVTGGPTGHMVRTESPLLQLFLIQYPSLATGRISGYIGISDFIFASLLLGSAFIFELNWKRSLLLLVAAFITTFALVSLTGMALPVLPVISLFFILSNWKHLEIKREDIFLVFYVLGGVIVVYRVILFLKH